MPNNVVLVDADEQDLIDRRMVVWANTFPNIPTTITIINYTELAADAPGMALANIQSAVVLKRYILGGYQAEYQFELIYRIKPDGSNDKRLTADALLNTFGSWASQQRPNIGENLKVIKIEPTTRATLFARYENGDEDHQILLKMTYERMN